jgi:hypothetical protein
MYSDVATEPAWGWSRADLDCGTRLCVRMRTMRPIAPMYDLRRRSVLQTGSHAGISNGSTNGAAIGLNRQGSLLGFDCLDTNHRKQGLRAHFNDSKLGSEGRGCRFSMRLTIP